MKMPADGRGKITVIVAYHNKGTVDDIPFEQGKDNVRDYLKEHKDIAREIEQKIRSIVGIVDSNMTPKEKIDSGKAEKEK